jgi:hypothetical protein
MVAAKREYPELPFAVALTRWIENDWRLPEWFRYPSAPRDMQKGRRTLCPRPGTTHPRKIPEDQVFHRVTFPERILIWGWPSLGGVIVLEHSSVVDFEFLKLDPLCPLEHRLQDQDAEDAFC